MSVIDVTFESTEAGLYGVNGWTDRGKDMVGDFQLINPTQARNLREQCVRAQLHVWPEMARVEDRPMGVRPTGCVEDEGGVTYTKYSTENGEVYLHAVPHDSTKESAWWRFRMV